MNYVFEYCSLNAVFLGRPGFLQQTKVWTPNITLVAKVMLYFYI